MLQSFCFHSLKPGPRLSVFGAVHGDEPSGTHGIRKVMRLIEIGELVLKQGSLIAVPIANPKAFEAGRRFIDRNLNRSFYPKPNPKDYEDFLDPILCSIIDPCDAHLDLHSYASPGGAFGFLGDTTPQEIEFSRSLGVNDFVYGWSAAYGRGEAPSKLSMGTVEYARSKGLLATTVETGQHSNVDGPDIAAQTLINAMAYLGLIEEPTSPALDQRFVQMKSVFYKTKDGQLTKKFHHFDEVKKGQVLAEFANGDEILAEEDGVIVLPKHTAEVGGEWFYFGVKTACPVVFG